MADDIGAISKHIPKDYPTSPDIEDRRNEPKLQKPPGDLKDFQPMPEIVLQSKPTDNYQLPRKARKQQ